MNIVYKKEIPFKELDRGEVFWGFGGLYMKIKEVEASDGALLNAVFLMHGGLFLFTDDEEVIKVNGAFVVE